MLTLLTEKIKAEGWAEGIAEGKAEGRREVAIKLLKSGYHRAPVAELTGLSKAEMDKLEG